MEDITLTQIVGVITACGVIIGVYVRLVKLIKSEIKEHDVEFMPEVDKLIDNKMGRAEKIETDKRVLRQDKYELEFTTLNKKADGHTDKLISLESEMKDPKGINDRLKDLENDVKNLREKE